MKSFKTKPVINKNNGQINISIPKKKLDNNLIRVISKGKNVKVNIVEWFE